jgi:CheY-like chemotaxis protein
MLPVWQLSSALDGLVNQLVSKPANVNPSTLRTIASAVDLLSALCIRGLRPDLATEPPVRLLAVDDDAISRHAISFALKKVFKEPELANDGKAGLALAEQNPYDVIFLDVEMPGMDGFELCSKIHDATINKKTPVVFVTRHSDINSRAKSSMTGGRELIGKPFLIFEVAVKALTLVMRSRLEAQGRAREAQAQKPMTPEAIVEPSGHLALA